MNLQKIGCIIYETEPTRFENRIPFIWTGTRRHISEEGKKMIVPMRIADSNLYIEGNQSSKSILRIINQTIEALGDEEAKFKAFW
jgi:hypothetical protein